MGLLSSFPRGDVFRRVFLPQLNRDMGSFNDVTWGERLRLREFDPRDFLPVVEGIRGIRGARCG